MEKYQFLTRKLSHEFTKNNIIFYCSSHNKNIIYQKVLSSYIFEYLQNIYENIQIKNNLDDVKNSIIFYVDNIFETELLNKLQSNNNILILNLIDQYSSNLLDIINFFSVVIISNIELKEYLYEYLNYIGESIFIPVPIYNKYEIEIINNINLDIDKFLSNNVITSKALIYSHILNDKFDIYFSNYLLVTCAYYNIKCIVYRCKQSESIFGKNYQYYFNNLDELSKLIRNIDDNYVNIECDLTIYKLEYIINKYYEVIDYCSALLDVSLMIDKKQISSGNRICLYTAVFGDYDNFNDIKFPEPDIDYYYLTDNINKNSKYYQFIKCPIIQNNFTISNRYFKILSHRYFKNYEQIILIDGNVEVCKNNLSSLCSNYIKNNLVAVHRHPFYNSLIQELLIIIERNLYNQDRQIIIKQIERYIEDGFPTSFPLTWNTVMFRKNDEIVNKFNEAWYSEFLKYCRRDQASFMYLIWKFKIDINIIDLHRDLLFKELNNNNSVKIFNINDNFLRYETH